MWRDTVEKRFFWASLEQEVEKILYELIKAEEEEDAGRLGRTASTVAERLTAQ